MSNLLLSKIGHVISEFPLAFKQTKEVKLFMTLLVKNEEGMLEENLQFHKAMGVDGFIITDNNSTDSTPDIIRKYKQKGWIKEVIEEKATNYEQKDWVDRMIWKAKTIYKADWIINADADELWYGPAVSLNDEWYATNANVLNCEMRSVYPEEEKPFWQWDKTVKAVTEPEKYDLSSTYNQYPTNYQPICSASDYPPKHIYSYLYNDKCYPVAKHLFEGKLLLANGPGLTEKTPLSYNIDNLKIL